MEHRLARAWRNLPVRTKGILTVAVPVLALFAATAATLWSQRQAHEAEGWVRHTYQVRAQLQHVLTLLVDAETGVRGFVLTGRPAFLEPYRHASRSLSPALSRLERRLSDNPDQRQRLERLRVTVAERLRLLDTMLSVSHGVAGQGGGPVAAVMLRGRAVMVSLRRQLAVIQAEEERLLSRRVARADRARQQVLAATALGTLIGVFGGGMATLLFATGIVHATERLEANAARLAAGLPLLPTPARGDELGRLASALERSAETLRRSEARFRRLVDANILGILHSDVHGNVLGANDAFLRIAGGTREELTAGRLRWEAMTPPEHLGRDRQAIAEARARGACTPYEKEYLRPDGSRVPILIGFALLEEGGDEAICFVLDLTEIKSAEAEILRLNERLIRRAVEIEAANRDLDAFSFTVAHDLRAPLRRIDGFAEALAEDCAPRLDETGREHLAQIRAAAGRMGELIDDLLRFAHQTRGAVRRECVDLSDLARAAVAKLRAAEPERSVAVAIEEGIRAEGDSRLLGVVMENLIGNAWKFSGRQPRARIEFGAMQNGGAPHYFVRDNGVGFDMAHADKLFGAFGRLHSAHEFPGTGIGLATVQRIIRRHGGRVWAEAAIDRGATFYFTLKDEASDD